MDDSKIFMFPDGGTRQTSNDVNSLLPLLMCNGGFGGGNWIWIIFLFFLYPLMRNGGLFGNMGQNCGGCLGPLANMVNNNDGRDLIMQAINGNGSAVQRLATMFGTKADMIQSAICQVNNSVAQVGCKIDSSTGALLNAGTQNTMTLANQLATCCCNLKNAITEGNYQNQIATIQQTNTIKQSVSDVGSAVSRGFSDVGYALRDQTCNLDKSIDGIGDRIIAKSVSYNNGNLIIAESKQTIQSEVEATLQHANYVVEHIEDYKNQITKCEEVLKELNPQFAKDKARDERIAGIENEVAGMKGDIAKILAAVTKN